MAEQNDAVMEFLLTRRSPPAKTLSLPAPSRTELVPILTAGLRVPDHSLALGLLQECKKIGVHAIAAPIRSEELSVVAAIGIGVHTSEVTKDVIRDKYLPLLLDAAKGIEHDWRKCAELPNSMAAINLDGLQLLHLRREKA